MLTAPTQSAQCPDEERPPYNRNDEDNRNDEGFSLVELVVVMGIIAALSVLAFVVFTNILGDARGTSLNANIQTAAQALQLEGSLRPNILTDDNLLRDAMSDRTTLAWVADDAGGVQDWGLTATTNAAVQVQAGGHSADRVWFQRLRTGPTYENAAAAVAPNVLWAPRNGSAVRLLIRNNENEWRCALVVFDARRVTAAAPVVGIGDPEVARIRGVWYDGGDLINLTTTTTAPPAAPAVARDQRLLYACDPTATSSTKATRDATAPPAPGGEWTPSPNRTMALSPSALD